VKKWLWQWRQVVLLNPYTVHWRGRQFLTLLIDKIANESENQEVDIVDRIDLRKVLDTLKPREKQIIVLRYFKEKTRFKLRKCWDIQVQVSRIEKKILEEIRKK